MKSFTLQNSNGMEVEVLDYGGIVKRIVVPDRNGVRGDVVLGFDDPNDYAQANPAYFGALIGRFANRIARARFMIDGKEYSVPSNDGRNALHGGMRGFDKVYWKVDELEPSRRLRLSYMSSDMEEGYPGNLNVQVEYLLNDDGELILRYSATTDEPTPLNLTHHSYFNLSGVPGTDILDHEIQIAADRFTPADDECIPTGELQPVHGPFDLRTRTRIGAHINEIKDGYNQNYVLNTPGEKNIVARVWHPASGRKLEVLTTEPGLQFYSGYFVDVHGKDGRKYERYAGLALEAQHFPDSLHYPQFPNTVLRPGETYRQTTTYRFGVY